MCPVKVFPRPAQRLGEHPRVVLQIGRFKAGQIVDLADVRRGIVEDDRYGARVLPGRNAAAKPPQISPVTSR
jgi:hypothetical protein